MVWKLKASAKADLRCSSTHLHQGVDKPHIVKMCVLPANGLSFPLKVHYERVNQDIFNPLVVTEEYEPVEDARTARGFPPEAVNPPQEEENEGLHAEGIDIHLGNQEGEGGDVDDLPPLPPPVEEQQGAMPPVLSPNMDAEKQGAMPPVFSHDDEVTAVKAEKEERRHGSFASSSGDGLLHVSAGHPADGIVYRNDRGVRVKLAKDGKPYPVGSTGHRWYASYPRPENVEPEVLRALKHQQEEAEKESKIKEEHRKEEGEVEEGDAAAVQEEEEKESEPWDTMVKGNPRRLPDDYVYEPSDSTLPTDIQELFAGSAGISKACIDMGLVVGTPMDLNTGFDLNKATGQAKAWRQIKKQHPQLVFMAPVCTAWSALSNTSPKEVIEEKRSSSSHGALHDQGGKVPGRTT